MKKVRITNFYCHYIGKIGTVIKENNGDIWRVVMENGNVLLPYSPNHDTPQCELVSDVVSNYSIY